MSGTNPPEARKAGTLCLPDEDDIEEAVKHSEREAAVCEICLGKQVDRSFVEFFDVGVCWPCKRADVTNNYKLITKSSAKADFLLGDRELEGLGCIEKPNPREYSGSGPMKLYLRRQVLSVAIAKYGSKDALDDEKHRRTVKRFEDGPRGKRSNARAEADLRPLKLAAMVEAHVHEYVTGSEVEVSAEEGTWEKACATCGFVVQFERM